MSYFEHTNFDICQNWDIRRSFLLQVIRFMLMQYRSVLLPVLLGIMVVGLFGVQDAFAQTPSIPQFLNPVEQSDTQIDVEWNEPVTGAPILSYNIYVESPLGNPLPESPISVPWTGSSEIYSHTELSPNTSYFYKVSAINSFGEGPKSPSQSTDTLESGNIITVSDEDSCVDDIEAEWTDTDTCTLLADASLDLVGGDQLIIASGIIFVVQTGATIDSSGTLENHGTINNSGDITFRKIINDDTINNFGTFTSDEEFDNTSGTVNNSGTFTNNGDFSNASGFIANNSVFINEAEFTNNGGSFTNAGTLTNNDFFSIDNAGTLANSAFGIIDNNSDFDLSGSIINSATINNAGTMTITSSGSIDNTGTINNSATIKNQCGPITGNLVAGVQPADECFPIVTILLPTTTTFTNQDLIDFSASASDVDNYGNDVGVTFVNNVIWTHQISPPATQFGTGATADDISLAEGTYTIIASVTDAGNNVSIDQLTIQINTVDTDGDGYLQAGQGVPANQVDCNDADSTIHPGATEIPADGVDQNCDTQELCYVDSDMDGYGDTLTVLSLDLICDVPLENKADNALDCDDTDPLVNPGMKEIFGDDIDNNCNDEIDEEKVISPVLQEDLTEKQIHKFEKLVDRWEHEIEKLNKEIIKLNEKADEAAAKGQLEKAAKLRAQADSKSEEVEILVDEVTTVEISIGALPPGDVLVHFQDKLLENTVKKIIKQIEHLEKKIDQLNSLADKFDEKAQSYVVKGKQQKADELFAKAAAYRAEAAVYESLQQVLICAVDYQPSDIPKPHHGHDEDDKKGNGHDKDDD